MKRKAIIFLAIIMGLLIFEVPASAQSEEAASDAPPIALLLIQEGEFALKLMEILGMEVAQDETEAQNRLAEIGIVPEKGWISDYPVTPPTLRELRAAISAAAEENRLPMGKENALEAFENLADEVGILVAAGDADQYTESEPPTAYPEYVDPEIVDTYYYTHGPPVVTYYLPPPPYYDLYTWVPFPFWYSRFFFHGFFVFHDFHKVVAHRHKAVIRKRFFDRRHKKYHVTGPRKWHGRNHTGMFRKRTKFSRDKHNHSRYDRKSTRTIRNRHLKPEHLVNRHDRRVLRFRNGRLFRSSGAGRSFDRSGRGSTRSFRNHHLGGESRSFTSRSKGGRGRAF